MGEDPAGVLCVSCSFLLEQLWPVGVDPVGVLCAACSRLLKQLWPVCDLVCHGVGIFNLGCAVP